MKLPVSSPFEDYIKTLPAGDRAALAEFFSGFDSHCILAKAEKRKLREDFEKTILYYVNSNLSLGRALELLDPANLGGFYARPAVLWFPLDDAAKIYPLSMKPGSMSVFRLSAYLKEPVVPELLQMALDFTIRRFPSFATTLKKGFFWHYLDTAKRRFTVSLESDIPCRPLKVSQSGSPAFRVLYWDRRISVEFFHVLTDGTGGMVFLKALTGEYLRLKGIDACVDKGPWALGETPSPEEFENAFARIEQSSSSSGFVERAALQMSGRLSENRPCRLLHFRMDAAVLHEAAKAEHAAHADPYFSLRPWLRCRTAVAQTGGSLAPGSYGRTVPGLADILHNRSGPGLSPGAAHALPYKIDNRYTKYNQAPAVRPGLETVKKASQSFFTAVKK